MKELYEKILKGYLEILNIHINTKTTDVVFHEKTSEFYEKLFEISHKLGEKYVDLGGKINNSSVNEQKEKVNIILKDLINSIESFKNNNNSNITLGTEDLLGNIANDLEDLYGTSKGFLQK